MAITMTSEGNFSGKYNNYNFYLTDQQFDLVEALRNGNLIPLEEALTSGLDLKEQTDIKYAYTISGSQSNINTNSATVLIFEDTAPFIIAILSVAQNDNFYKAVDLLKEYNADFNSSFTFNSSFNGGSPFDGSALHILSANKDTDLAQITYLIEAGANPTLENSHFLTAYDICQKIHPEFYEELLQTTNNQYIEELSSMENNAISDYNNEFIAEETNYNNEFVAEETNGDDAATTETSEIEDDSCTFWDIPCHFNHLYEWMFG